MQDMIDKNESCRIIQNGDETIVKLRPISILDSLKGKLSDADIHMKNTIKQLEDCIDLGRLRKSQYIGFWVQQKVIYLIY